MNNDSNAELERQIIEYARSLKCPVITPLEIAWKFYKPFGNDSNSEVYRPVLRVMNSMAARGLLHKTGLSNNVCVFWLPERENVK